MKKIRDGLDENHFIRIGAHAMLGSQIPLNILDMKQNWGQEFSFEFPFFFNEPSSSNSTSGMTSTLQAVEVERLAGESQSSSVQSAGTCRLDSRIWGNSGNESHGSVKNWWSQEPKQKIWALLPHHKDTCTLYPLRSSPRGIRAFLEQWGYLLPSVLFCFKQ